jgi:hypothetical protein
MAKPTRVTVLSFQVAFGDCFMLRFQYPNNVRKHMLVDFGSFPRPSWLKKGAMTQIAQAISTQCGGKLDALVCTHRHADHISGFATDIKNDDSGSVIAACKPDLVIQPWTEDPDARTKAKKPTAAFMGAAGRSDAAAQALAFDRGRQYVDNLDAMQALAPIVRREAVALKRGGFTQLAEDLHFFGENSVANQSAVKNLIDMGNAAKHGARFLYYGAESGLEEILPGVKVRVLGPPTLEQSDEISHYAKNSAEYWRLQAVTARSLVQNTTGIFPDCEPTSWENAPPHARWLVQRLRTLRGRQLLEIVLSMDKWLNNTSVILLLEVGNKKFLLPGDAQLENWQYAMAQPGVLELLSKVDFYKVGHHGSLNATPKSLWQNFAKKDNGLTTAVSTMGGVHGHSEDKTEVPRRTLVSALRKHSAYNTTQTVSRKAGAFREIPIDV